MDGRYDNVSPRHVAKVFDRRFKHKLLEIADVFCLVGLFEQFHAPLHVCQALASFVCRKGGALGFVPRLLGNEGRFYLFVDVLQEVSHLGHVPEAEAVHRLYQFAADALFPQEGYQDDGFFVGLGQHTRGTVSTVTDQVFDEWLIHIGRVVVCHLHPSVFFSHGEDRGSFDSFSDDFGKFVGETDRMACASVVLGHFDKPTAAFLGQAVHVFRVRTAEFVDVLVVVAHCNDAHFFVIGHQGTHQCIFFVAHVLCLVYHQYRFPDSVGFHFTLFYHFGSFGYYVFGFFQIAYPSQQVETIGMEGLYFDKVGGVADQFHQPLLEFRCRCS